MAGMQAAVLLRNKKKKKHRQPDLPANVATKQIKPFPTYPPEAFIAESPTNGHTQHQESKAGVNPEESAEDAQKHRKKATEAHRKWLRKNKVSDSSLLDDDEEYEVEGIYQQSGAANVVLYVGLIMTAVGMVITFVGIGEKGFKTLELKLIGPSLIISGIFFCLLRILFCTCPLCYKCCNRRQKKDFDNASLIDAESMVNGHANVAKFHRKKVKRTKNHLPNYISDDDDLSDTDKRGTINPDPDAHRLEDESRDNHRPGPSRRRESNPTTVPRLPAISPRRELVLTPSALDDRELKELLDSVR